MSTKIRSRISRTKRYWISAHRYYELKHFCLQYNEWYRKHEELANSLAKGISITGLPKGTDIKDVTGNIAAEMADLATKVVMVEQAAHDADPELATYILAAVTDGRSYTYLQTAMNIPCSKDTYYDRYRRFFWLLSKARD